MKKTHYLLLFILFALLTHNKSNAQTITSHYEYQDSTICGSTEIVIYTDGYTAGQTITAFFGDGSSATSSVYLYGTSGGNAAIWHTYTSPGTYTVKLVLYSGTTTDTVQFSRFIDYCTTLQLSNYIDENSNCVFDAGEARITTASGIEVDSAGVPIDTVYCLYGWDYAIYGPAGTVYQFRVLSATIIPGLAVTCPASGILTCTVPASGTVPPLAFGFNCVTATTPDLALYANFKASATAARAFGNVVNSTCTPATASVKIDFSPKYTVASVIPAYPYTISGNSITLNLSSVSILNPKYYNVNFDPVGTPLMGDTVQSTQTVYPTADPDPTNNSVSRIDTIKASLDPNHKSVMPTGNITAGATLQYMLEFENTGNDTAHNISILDTLSDFLDANTVRPLTSSHAVVTTQYVAGGKNIVKFNFPNIMLADSSHHDANKGMVTFSIKAKPTLAPGTVIPNRAGIYFDTNPVVMTNTAYSKIPLPGEVNNIATSTMQLYPNPVRDILNISASANSTITVTDLMGRTIISQYVTTGQATINVKQLLPGMYFISVRGEDGVNTQKFEKL